MSEVEAPGGRKAKSQQKRREAVLAAADRLFRSVGYDAARIEDIAEHSEVSLGTIYNYFGSKGGIMEALIAPMTRRMQARG
ncbi:helix-turn-helix domain-containing protein, partial [Parvibaculum sp.]